jgi:hypothetical protein
MTLDEAKESVRSTARGLVGTTILTLAQRKPNEVVNVSDEGVTVRAKSTAVVSWEMIDSVVEALFDRSEVSGEELRRDRVPGGFRSAFIFTLLDRTPFVQAKVERGKIHLMLVRPPRRSSPPSGGTS